MECPKCGFAQDDGGAECARCGVVFRKLRDRPPRPAPEAPPEPSGSVAGARAEAVTWKGLLLPPAAGTGNTYRVSGSIS